MRAISSVGQSSRLITGRSGVRVPVGAPKKKVLKRVLSFYFTVMREQGLEGEREENSPADCF